MHPLPRPVPTWHSQPTTQKRFRNFPALVMPEISSPPFITIYTNLDNHVIMFIQCYYVSNAEVSQWKEKRVNSCIKTWI